MADDRQEWSPRPRGRRGPRRKAVRVTAWAVAGTVLTASVVGGGYVYHRIDGNILGVDINGRLGGDRPDDVDNGSMDILVLGSDSRAGENGEYGRNDGTARSDTAMIVHLHESHERASIVSIPRDTLVDRPACVGADETVSPAAAGVMFNDSYSVGGPVCAVKTVESMTGIRMDHYIEIDFTGFKELLDALGGVTVTLTRAIHDEESRLDLEAGTHTLTGEQALGLVRTRHGVGDGSDLGRIRLQQAFMRALIEQVSGVGLFSDPSRLYGIADAATGALTTDSELDSVQDLMELAGSLRNLGPDDTTMVTMPVRYDPAVPGRVVPLEARSRQVWDALRQDREIPASVLGEVPGGDTGAKGVIG